ncbi:uncharacterized protein SPPG_06091 [Spizellomyces punctatus DAOM BR117]|uniref:Heme oxygenase n=1 Tax=Spizellomyces punctatus (strain DAOM BR117) TaxID=645134 RepID=A0A0L0H9Z8_SPIPD|nr:uncharacterized protein SPPG_06091 [Spizellomyces punctatus DAOM BR117]KNC98385.1 hypothetical protein SPPG_06091 [Spizellomyces punctatus DAOM BR117]|eukprot:XP_016606425.1 hypothetical protein SPPG_06091 [Spizellomyces punctatus DAOM BR117]
MSNQRSLSLSDRINLHTRKVHSQNHWISNIKLLICLLDHQLYARLVRQFYELYKTVEDEVTRHIEAGDEAGLLLKQVAMREIFREEAFREDARYWCGPDWRDWKESGPMKKYKAHVKELSEKEPVVLLAYLYTMYLGLFAGGQLVRRKLAKKLGFAPSSCSGGSEGLSIFTFSNPIFELKRAYHQRFDALELSEDVTQRILDEAQLVFAKNLVIIADLEGLPGALWRLFIVRLWWIWMALIAVWFMWKTLS